MYDISQLARSGRGLTRLGVAYAVIALGTGTAQFGVQAQEETARYQPRQATAAPVAPNNQPAAERQNQKSRDRWADSNLSAFKSPKGRIVLTNNPDKFRNRRGYSEVDARTARPVTRPAPATYQYRGARNVKAVSVVRGIPADIKGHVEYFSRQNNLDESLVYAVIRAESNFNANARSSKGAQGLMQLMPATAKQLGVRDPFDARENIRGGTRYLAKLLARFNGDLHSALAGYNAGPEKVKEFGGIPPYKETRDFVRRVIRYRNEFHDGDVVPTTAFASTKTGSSAIVSSGRRSDYLVQFTSGHTQQAQNVIDDGEHYIIEYRGRSFKVKKTQIRSVTQPA